MAHDHTDGARIVMSLPSLTIVIPMYNEEGNVRPLFDALEASMRLYDGTWFAILVNDGSRDRTGAYLDECVKAFGENYQHIELQRNFGQTAAMQAGIDAAQTELIATMDGDLQNDPEDIPRLVNELLLRDLDLLQGWRKKQARCFGNAQTAITYRQQSHSKSEWR